MPHEVRRWAENGPGEGKVLFGNGEEATVEELVCHEDEEDAQHERLQIIQIHRKHK